MSLRIKLALLLLLSLCSVTKAQNTCASQTGCAGWDMTIRPASGGVPAFTSYGGDGWNDQNINPGQTLPLEAIYRTTVYTYNSSNVIINTTPTIGQVTQGLTWVSENPAVAAVDQNGVVTGVSGGRAIIDVTDSTPSWCVNGFCWTSSIAVNVSGQSEPTPTSIVITPSSLSINTGGSQTFTATVTCSDGTTNDCGQIAFTNSFGTLTQASQANQIIWTAPNSAGTGTVTADVSVFSSVADITVTSNLPPTPTGIFITPSSVSVAPNSNTTFTATENCSDGTTNDCGLITWAATIGALSLQTGTQTVWTAPALGSGQLTATAGSISTGASLAVNPPTPTAVSVIPNALITNVNLNTTFAANVSCSDGTTNDCGTVSWSNTIGSIVAQPNNTVFFGAPGTPGTGVVVASIASLSATVQITVNASTPTLQSITITPATSTHTVGATQQYQATGNYSDGSTKPVTTGTWSSSSTAVATINQNGLATGVSRGTANLTDTLNGVVGTAIMTVVKQPTVTAPACSSKQSNGLIYCTVTWTAGTNPIVTVTVTATTATEGARTFSFLPMDSGGGFFLPYGNLKGHTTTFVVTATDAFGFVGTITSTKSY